MPDEKPIPGTQRVAAFLLSLNEEVGAEVMRHLDPKVVSHVAEAMTELEEDLCSSEAVDGLYADLARTMFQRAGVRCQDELELQDILERSYGKNDSQRVIGDIHNRRRTNQPFGFLDEYDPVLVARLLKPESPVIVTLVLSHISPAASAQVLGSMEDDKAFEIVRRMTTVVPPSTETMLVIADGLRSRAEAFADGPAPHDPEESIRTVADLLNFSPPDTERAVLEGMEEHDEEITEEIREHMFTWENLADIDKRAMQKILASVDTRTLAMSIKASSAAVEENVMNNLSIRVKEMVADERDLAGPVPFTEVVECRAEILKCVRAMMEAGEFAPTRAGEDLVS